MALSITSSSDVLPTSNLPLSSISSSVVAISPDSVQTTANLATSLVVDTATIPVSSSILTTLTTSISIPPVPTTSAPVPTTTTPSATPTPTPVETSSSILASTPSSSTTSSISSIEATSTTSISSTTSSTSTTFTLQSLTTVKISSTSSPTTTRSTTPHAASTTTGLTIGDKVGIGVASVFGSVFLVTIIWFITTSFLTSRKNKKARHEAHASGEAFLLRQRKSDLETWKQGGPPAEGLPADGTVVLDEEVPKSPVRMRGSGRLDSVAE